MTANATMPGTPSGASASVDQPAAHTANPSTSAGPGPIRRTMRLPKALARIVPAPSAT